MDYLEQKILDYMKENRKGLTVRECTQKLGTTELRKIVSSLRDKGRKIGDIWEVGIDKYGIKKRWKRYFLM